MTQTTYFANEIRNDDTLKGTGYYQAVRIRAGQLPEICPHRHVAAREAIRCREFSHENRPILLETSQARRGAPEREPGGKPCATGNLVGGDGLEPPTLSV